MTRSSKYIHIYVCEVYNVQIIIYIHYSCDMIKNVSASIKTPFGTSYFIAFSKKNVKINI